MAREKCGLLAVRNTAACTADVIPIHCACLTLRAKCSQLATALWTVSYLYGVAKMPFVFSYVEYCDMHLSCMFLCIVVWWIRFQQESGSDTHTGDISESHLPPSWSGSGTHFAQPKNDLYCYTIPECTVEAPHDGWLWHLKHVEQRTKENKIDLLHLVGILFIIVTCILCMDFAMAMHMLLLKNTKGIFPIEGFRLEVYLLIFTRHCVRLVVFQALLCSLKGRWYTCAM
jgi:hypothetical protein